MRVIILKSFEKDISKVSNKILAQKLLTAISELESTNDLSTVAHLKKLKTEGHYFRLRVGDYRLGFKLEKETITLLRFMHRKDIYKFFP